MTNNEKILLLKKEHNLKNLEVAELIGSGLNTVKNWFKDPTANGSRTAPDHAVRCLIYGLHLRKLGVDPLSVERHTLGDDLRARESA